MFFRQPKEVFWSLLVNTSGMQNFPFITTHVRDFSNYSCTFSKILWTIRFTCADWQLTSGSDSVWAAESVTDTEEEREKILYKSGNQLSEKGQTKKLFIKNRNLHPSTRVNRPTKKKKCNPTIYHKGSDCLLCKALSWGRGRDSKIPCMAKVALMTTFALWFFFLFACQPLMQAEEWRITELTSWP